jgi:LysM repeat protein
MRAGIVIVGIGVVMWLVVFGNFPGRGSADDAPTVTPTPVPVATLPPSSPTPAFAEPTPDPDTDPDPGPEASGTIYIVQSGDNLSGIAQQHGVTLQEILAANPEITDPTRISVGQEIRIPE